MLSIKFAFNLCFSEGFGNFKDVKKFGCPIKFREKVQGKADFSSSVQSYAYLARITRSNHRLADIDVSLSYAQQHSPKPKSKTTCVSEPRRSTRARNPVPSYRDDVSNHIGAADGRTK